MEIQELLLSAIKASLKAGKAIMEVYNRDFDVSFKQDHTPLTEADRQAHEVIQNELAATDISFLSEESSESSYIDRKTWQLYWLVDPLDGTKEFVNRNGEFTVNIALIEQCFPRFGVIYAPVDDLLYYNDDRHSYRLESASGYALSLSMAEIKLKSKKLPCYAPAGIRIVASRSHMNRETELVIDEFVAGSANYELVNKGSSLKFCALAEGSAHFYPRFGPTMEWDTAAGQAIAERAGCIAEEVISGERLRYNKENLLNPNFVVRRKHLSEN